MIYAIFSDIHGNRESLAGFRKVLRKLKPDRIVCGGDIVGYNADPNHVANWVRKYCHIALGGNHDYAVVKRTDTSYFNPYAFHACAWTRGILTPANRKFLESLSALLEADGITWAHASPFEPEEWHYITSDLYAEENFRSFQTRMCFVGHSHIPLILEQEPGGEIAVYGSEPFRLKPDCRYIVNVGSLGQPRDRNPDACFVVYDSEEETIVFHRLPYDIATTQDKILKAGLPSFLADRLGIGR